MADTTIALRTIAEFPITDPSNMDAMNMREIALNALQAAKPQAGEATQVTKAMIDAGLAAAKALDPALATLYPSEITAVYQAMALAAPAPAAIDAREQEVHRAWALMKDMRNAEAFAVLSALVGWNIENCGRLCTAATADFPELPYLSNGIDQALSEEQISELRKWARDFAEATVVFRASQDAAPAPAAAGGVTDERAAFITWLGRSYPRTYDEEDAAHLWDRSHVAALAWQARAALAQPAPVQEARQGDGESVKLDDIEQYRMQMAGICTAAIGYWKEGESVHPDYDTLALRDVAKLYAKYDALYKSADRQALIDWAVERWNAEVKKRPMVNIHRRSLDDAWRQVLRYLGVDDRERLGPTHDELRAEIGSKEWEAMNGKAAPVQREAATRTPEQLFDLAKQHGAHTTVMNLGASITFRLHELVAFVAALTPPAVAAPAQAGEAS